MRPIGLVNVYPEGADTVDPCPRRFLVQNTLVSWHPSLARCDSILNVNRTKMEPASQAVSTFTD